MHDAIFFSALNQYASCSKIDDTIIAISHCEGRVGPPRLFADYRLIGHEDQMLSGVQLLQLC